MAPQGTQWPAVLSLQTSGSMTGIRLESDPQPGVPFIIPGGEEQRGSLKICSSGSTSNCLAPTVEEGRAITVTVTYNHPTTGAYLFDQQVRFTNDNAPPAVTSASVVFDAQNNMNVTVVATDQTTSPIGATVWHSVDGGVTWSNDALETTSDLNDDIATRTFSGTIGPFPSAAVKAMVVVNDSVGNEIWYAVTP